jgi:hypothetical protein
MSWGFGGELSGARIRAKKCAFIANSCNSMVNRFTAFWEGTDFDKNTVFFVKSTLTACAAGV